MSIILGIDPGSRRTGFGVIDTSGSTPRYVTSGCINVVKLTDIPARLDAIFSHIQDICVQVRPTECAIEQVFLGRNVDSALKLGHARGAAMVAVLQSGVPVHEYAARQVKQAIVGKGSATKEQVQHMVRILLSLPGTPQEDAADALAIALCHANFSASMGRIAGAVGSRRGRTV